MKKDSFNQFMVNHEGYIMGLAVVFVCLIVAIATKIPEAIWSFSIMLSLMIASVYFGYKKWKKNQ